MAQLTPELVQCLPESGPIRAYVEWASSLSHTPPILHATSILPVMSFDLCRRGLYTQHYGHPQLWFAAIGSPATGKTNALAWAQDFSKDWYRELFGHEESGMPKPWVSLQGSLPGVLHTLANMYDPLLKRTLGILYHTEFTSVLSQDDASEPLRQLFDGRPIDRNLRYLQKQKDRGEDVNVEVKAPTFAAIVNTTLSDLKRVANQSSTEGGLFSRFLWFYEHLKENELQPRVLSDHAGRARVMAEWLRWAGSMEGYRLAGLVPEIAFEPAALQFIDREFFAYVRGHLVTEGAMSGVALRALSHAGRLAAVYAVSQLRFRQDRLWVTLPDVYAAANLVARAYQAAFYLSQQIGQAYQTYADKAALLVNAVELAGVAGYPRRDAYKLFHGHVAKGEMDLIVQSLIDAERIVEHGISTGGRGRPSMRFFSASAWAQVQAASVKTN